MPEKPTTPPDKPTDDAREKWLAEINATIARINAALEHQGKFETNKAK